MTFSRRKTALIITKKAALIIASLLIFIFPLISCKTVKETEKSFSEIFAAAAPSVAVIKTNSGSAGTGFAVKKSESGLYVATNKHLFYTSSGYFNAATFEKLTFFEGQTASAENDGAKIIGYNSYHDIAVIFIPKASPASTSAPLKLSSKVYGAGEKLLNIGNSYNYGIAAFDGIVSLYEQALLVDQFNKRVPVMQITAAVNEGSSGSPVLDVYGNVAGMGAYQILNDANSRAILDMNFAIPALIVSKITAGIISENPVGDKAAEEYNSLSLQLVKNSSEKFEIDFGTLGFKGIVADGKIKVTNVSGSFSSLAFGSGTLLEEGDEIVQFGYDDGALTGVFDIFASAENYEYTTGPQSAQRRFILKFMRGGKQFSVSYNNVYEKIIG